MVKHNLRTYISILLLISTSGCALFSSSKSKSNQKINVPKVSTVTPPGGDDNSWRYLGLSDDGQLIVEINESTITPTNKAQIYNYQDRKTVANPDKFTAYTSGQPHYKFLLSNWQMDCNLKQYIILNTTLYDQLAVQQLRYDYTNNTNVKWIKVGNGSLAELQYKYICLNQKRNLGY